ncbi:MAG: metallophosphoesterase family protein [Dehalococcoidia bacterium]
MVRIAIVSDVHANLQALEAVLRHAQEGGAIDAIWALGDLVGYGPQPVECLTRLREFPLHAVAGNHDLAAIGAIDTDDFNAAAAEANRWNANQLGAEERKFLADLPLRREEEGIQLAHGSLRDPAWEYMFTIGAAIAQFEIMTTPTSLVGHTHVPLVFEEYTDRDELEYWQPRHGDALPLEGRRLIVNPGSVGQPRDGNPQAAYAVFDADTRTIRFQRVKYDIKATQRIMQAAGLPAVLIKRLSLGR